MNDVGIVAIGRNEGERLERCLRSVLSIAQAAVYVDSGSTDASIAMARELGAEVVALDVSVPFTAARARNAGFQALIKAAPDLKYVQFVDGDCEIAAGWLDRARSEFESRSNAAVVTGRRRERFPEATIYNRLCDIEWNTPIGEAPFCGGDAMMLVAAFQAVQGFNPSVIAGEEPELCLRLRRLHWKVLRIDADMTFHDAAMTTFSQWWTRALRCGYAYSLGASMHGAGPEGHFVRERWRLLLWGFAIPTFIALIAWPTDGWGLLLILFYPVQVVRITARTLRRGIALPSAFAYGIFCVLAKFPEFAGFCKFQRDRLSSRPAQIIEYKKPIQNATVKPSTNESPLSVLVIATNWVPISARVAVRFVQHGCAVSALCPRGHLLRHVSGMRNFYGYNPFDLVASQASALESSRPDIVVPCDDAAVWQLHETHQQRPEFRDLIEKSIGKSSEYACIRSRAGFIAFARQTGLRTPDTERICCERDLEKWSFRQFGPAVMKLDGTSGGHGVKVVRSETEARAAFREFTRPLSAVGKWKRHFVNCDPLAFWPKARPSAEICLQAFISGRPANAMFACWRGELLGLVAVEVLASQGETGAGTIIRFIQSAEIQDMSKCLAARLCLSGFYGLDFVIEEATGAPFLIELNPRCTQLGHLVLREQGDLVGAVCRCLGSKSTDCSEPPIDGGTVAFFPQALAWTPDSPYFNQSHQDIPWREPGLARELLRDIWPERRWPQRLYRRLRGRHPDPKPHLENLASSEREALQKMLGQLR